METTINKICKQRYDFYLDHDTKHLIQRLISSLIIKMTRNSIKIMNKLNKKIFTKRILKLVVELCFHSKIRQEIDKSIENTLDRLKEHHGNIRALNQEFSCSIFKKLINDTFLDTKIDYFVPPLLSDISSFITSYVLDNCYNRETNNITHNDIVACCQNNPALQHLFYNVISEIEAIQTPEINLNIHDLHYIIYADITDICDSMSIKIHNDSTSYEKIIAFAFSLINKIVRKMKDINDDQFGYDDCIYALGKLDIESTDASLDILEEYSIFCSIIHVAKMYNPNIKISIDCLTLIHKTLEKNIYYLLNICNNYVTYNCRKMILCRDIEFIINLIESKDQ